MRKTTWKEVKLQESWKFRALESCRVSFGELKAYTISVEPSVGAIETNLPWSLLRQWFSFAGVPFPKDVLVADLPSWEIYKDE